MRSIICISLMMATPAGAGPLITPGCWARDYGPEHLARQPAQIVDEMYLRFSHDPKYDTTLAEISVLLADQGHVAGTEAAGQIVDQGLICWVDDVAAGCSVECDGGWFTITSNDGEVMDIRTEYLQMGEGQFCGGMVDLSEGPGQPTTYRLMRVANSVCEARMNR